MVRHHIAGEVQWRHFPLFILNKAISLAAVLFVTASCLVGKAIHWHRDAALVPLLVEREMARDRQRRAEAAEQPPERDRT